MEHVYDPREIINCAATLQSEGDHFIAILPNGLTEAPITKLLYLPHLHSYSKDSLEKNLNNNGYKVVQDSTDGKEIILVAQKIKIGNSFNRGNDRNNFNKISEELIRDLKLNQAHLTKLRRLWWGKNTGPTLQSLYFQNKFLNKLYFRFLLKISYLRFGPFKYHSCLITSADKYYSDSPIEIQFKDKIKLIYK